MTIHRTLGLVAVGFLVLILAIGALLAVLINAQHQQAVAEARKYASLDLALELKQSSDELTRFARTFAATGNPDYEAHFQAIIAIRDGRRQHPAAFTRSYWDHVAAGAITANYDGETYSIAERMDTLGFSDREKALIGDAKRESDALIALEDTAMNAVKGRFRDEAGNFTVEGPPDLEVARAILFGEAYHQAKSRIMTPIHQFFAALEGRTADELAHLASRTRGLTWAVIAATAALVFLSTYLYFVLRARVLAPIALLERGAEAIESGDYAHHVAVQSGDEMGVLANAFNDMAGSIEDRSAKLKDSEERFRRAHEQTKAILNESPFGVTVTDVESGHVVFANPHAAKIFGMSVDDLLDAKATATYADPEDRAKLTFLMDIQGAIRNHEVRMKRADGSEFWDLLSLMAFEYENRPSLLAWHYDLTARKDSEAEVMRQKGVLETLMENMDQGISMFDNDLNLVAFNQKFLDVLDLPAGRFAIGDNFEAFMRFNAERGEYGEGDVEEQIRQRVDLARKFEAHRFERERPDGTVFEIRGTPVEAGGIVTIYSDVTEQRSAQREIAHRQSLLDTVLENMSDGIFAMDKDLKLTMFNDRWPDLVGYSGQPVHEGQDLASVVRYIAEQGFYGPGDIDQLVDERLIAFSSPEYIEREITTHEDKVVHLRKTALAEGGAVVVLSDITARKRAETALADAYDVISSSIQYASRIQRSMLPDEKVFQEVFSDYFVHWEPRDVVGGDMYWCNRWGDGAVFMLGDCTGHGVPGAFMTLIAVGALDRAQMEVAQGDVAGLLQRMHQLVQITVNQHVDSGESDDGMELGICYVHPDRRRLTYAGARFSLFVAADGEVDEVKGDRAGIGYRGIPQDQSFMQTVVDLTPDQQFYMTSDGLIDQVGGKKRRSFGKRRFKDLIAGFDSQGFDLRRQIIVDAFKEYQGDQLRRDDVAVMGFAIRK